MQVSLKFAIPLLILVPLIAWIMGTRKYDFVTPPSPFEGEILPPEFAEPVDPAILASLKRTPEPAPLLPPAPPPEIIDPGDFMVSPSIDEYRADASKGPASLLNLANTLLEQGQALRALLAFERILDSTTAGGPERLEAAPQLPALRDQLPPWNIDPAAAIPLTLSLMSARAEDTLAPILDSLRELIEVSSGGQTNLQVQFTAHPAPAAELPSLPVMLWLSVPGEDPAEPALPIANISGNDDNTLLSNLIKATYEQLSQRLRSFPELTSPPDFPAEAHPATHFSQSFTLLMWQKILTSPFQSIGPEGDISSPSEDNPLLENDNLPQDKPTEER